jgi:small subunit ribosomal protein S14
VHVTTDFLIDGLGELVFRRRNFGATEWDHREKEVENAVFSTKFCAPFMAKTAWINRNKRKRATAKKYAAVRAELKAKKDYAGLAQLPRDASPTRVVNRCEVTGRRRAFIRRFKISRLTFRELASQGLIPGVTKSSW